MKKFLSVFMSLVLAVMLSSCTEKKVTRQSFAFDTVVNITADEKYQKEISEAFSLCQDYEKIFSRTNEKSELYLINKGEITAPSQEIKEVLEFSLSMSDFTDGAFDITVAPLVDLWDVNKRTSPPSQDEIEKAREIVGYKKVSEEPFSLGGTSLDMGAVAKGYIADKLTDYFRGKGVEDAIIDLGGNVALIGEHTVGIRNPKKPDEIFAVMTLHDKSAVTSGAYQRYFEYEGKRYHHIIDPRSGNCADSVIASVTVISPSSMQADALSTAIYILGEDALSLCESFPDTDAIIIKEDGKVVTTDGFSDKYHLEYK